MLWHVLLYLCGVLLRASALLGLVWMAKELTMGLCVSKRRLDGRTAVVIGGVGGVGYETALELARRGAEVVLVGAGQTESTAERIRTLTENVNVHSRNLDHSLLADVRCLAKEMLLDFPKIHFLINNAGDGGRDFFTEEASKGSEITKMTTDGLEWTMSACYLGPFLLCELLLPAVTAAGHYGQHSRLLHLTSPAAKWAARPDLLRRLELGCGDALAPGAGAAGARAGAAEARVRAAEAGAGPTIDGGTQYANAKLLVCHHSRHLARRLRGTCTESAAVNPGLVRGHRLPPMDPALRLLARLALWLVGKSPWQGMQTILHLVLLDTPIPDFGDDGPRDDPRHGPRDDLGHGPTETDPRYGPAPNGLVYEDCRPAGDQARWGHGDDEQEEKIYQYSKRLTGLA